MYMNLKGRFAVEYPGKDNPIGCLVRIKHNPEYDKRYNGFFASRRRSGFGKVVNYSNDDGLCFEIKHNDEDMGSWYEPDEITILTHLPNLSAADPGGCPCNYEPHCLCVPAERVLRLYAFANKQTTMSPMTSEMREECLIEIDRVEGYSRKDYESSSDAHLANGVLHAWVDYCRDKGLI